MTQSFKRYLIAFDKYKWLGLASFIVVMGASGVVALKTKASPNYVANGTLTYNDSPVLSSTNNNQIQQQEQIPSEDVLLSNELIKNVAEDTQLSVKQIRNNLSVNLPEKTQTGELKTSVITVKYKDTDPQRAKETLLAVMKKIEQEIVEYNTNAMQPNKKKINGSLESKEKELKQAEADLAEHERIHNSGSIAVEIDNLGKTIADNQTQQQQIQQKLSSIDAQTIGSSYSQAFIASTFSTDPSIAKLLEQINQTQLKLTELESIFLPTHPNVIKLQEQLTADNERLQKRTAEAVRSLRQQLKGLKQSEVKLRQKYTSVSDKQRKRSPFEQEVQRHKTDYEQLLAKLKEVEMAEAATISSWNAQEPSVALEEGFFSQSTPVILGIGALLGVLVGGGLIALLGSLEGKFQTWEEIGESLQERQTQLLGILPLIGSEADSQTLPVISLNSPYIEFYERCRINLRSFGGKALKVVLLSSTVNFEGKTVSAYNLGVVSARAGKKTLIVEADLRSPSQSQFLGVTPPRKCSRTPALLRQLKPVHFTSSKNREPVYLT